MIKEDKIPQKGDLVRWRQPPPTSTQPRLGLIVAVDFDTSMVDIRWFSNRYTFSWSFEDVEEELEILNR
jgi:hypothetical protein